MAGFTAPADDLAPAGAVNAFGDPVAGGSLPSGRHAHDLGSAIVAGLQNSATGLAIRGKLPDQQLGEDAPWYHRLAASAAGVAADLPLSAVGAVAAAPAGSMLPGPGNVIAGAAGAFAAPMALREALIEAYSHNYALSWEGAWEIAKAGLKGGGKGAALGAVTGGAGAIAGRVVGGMVAPAVGTSLTAQGAIRSIEGAAFGSELATLTAASSALEGRLPTWQDFMDNAILLGGMKAATHTAQGLRNIWAETGKTPEQVRADAETNPELKAALADPKIEIPSQYSEAALEQRIRAAIDVDPRPEALRSILSNEEKSGPIPNDPVKYEYISDTDTAKGVLREVTSLYQAEINAQTRGVVPNKQTAAEGMKLITDGAVAPHIIGEANSAAEIYARAHLLRGAANDAVAQLQKLAGIPEAELSPAAKLQALASIERVAMLKAEIEGAGAEAGRALQIFRAVKRDPSFLGEAETLLRLAERKGALQDVAKLVADLKDPAQIARFAQDYLKATTTEKVLEAWRAAILSGPQTHLANIFGNLTKMLVELPESTISASLLALDKAAHGEPMTLAQWKARAFAPYYGIKLGAVESLHAAAEVWKMKGEHVEKADQFRQAIEGKVGDIVRLPFKALQVEDVLFRTMAERAEAYKLAVDRAVKEGVHPETSEFRERVALYTSRPEFGLDAAQGKATLEQIQQIGAESVFAQRLGPRMEIAQRAMAGSVFSFIVPFVRTPANLISWAVQHTPGLNLLSGRWRADFSAGGEAQARALARVVVGTGLAATAYTLAESGVLTGGGMFDKEQRGTKGAAGWQPYSIKIGDKFYSFQRIEPVAKVLGLAADLVELGKNLREDDDKAKVATLLVLMFGNATVSTTYLSGLSNAIQAIQDPGRYGQNFLEQYATSLVPKAIGQAVTMADPHKREVEGVIDAIQSQLPFLREKLMPKRDVWGEPQNNDRWFGVMPVATSEVSHEKVRTEAARLQVAIADAPRFAEEKGPFNPRDKRVELNQEARDIYRQVSGKNAMEILGPIVNAPDWNQIPDFAKAAIYKHVLQATRKQGEYSALPPDAEARQQLREKILNRIIKETQEPQTTPNDRKNFGGVRG